MFYYCICSLNKYKFSFLVKRFSNVFPSCQFWNWKNWDNGNIQWNLYDKTGEVLLKTHKFQYLYGTVFTKSCLFSLSWETTCLERPQNLVVALYRFYCILQEAPHCFIADDRHWRAVDMSARFYEERKAVGDVVETSSGRWPCGGGFKNIHGSSGSTQNHATGWCQLLINFIRGLIQQ